jgi:hypothetical protein
VNPRLPTYFALVDRRRAPFAGLSCGREDPILTAARAWSLFALKGVMVVRHSRASSLVRRSLPGLILVLAPALAGAQQASPSPPPPPPVSEERPRLAFHGYLTQAYAISDDVPLLGIPTEGTTDYRTLALQFRYAIGRRDTLIAQLSHERFGKSAFASLKNDVELDWGFYERQLGDHTSLRVGKVLLPLGIYNEIRDVGTLLPFYRPPFNVYGEGVYTSETVDGLALSHRFRLGRHWAAEASTYYGGFDLLESNPLTGEASVARANHDLGFQVWLETPLSGLRVGLAGFRLSLRDQLLAPPDPEVTVKALQVSVDGSFDRFTARAEVQHVTFAPGRYLALTGHVGARLTRRLSVNAQADRADVDYTVPVTGPRFDGRFQDDYAFGFNWAFRADLVLKAEGHWAKGYRIDLPVNFFFDPARRTRYAILSLSATF